MSANRKSLLILGAHRSGTSALAAALLQMGVDFGDPNHFIDPTLYHHNPNGFYELEWVNLLNDEIFQHLGTRWQYPAFFQEERLRASDLANHKDRIKSSLREEFGGRKPLIGIKDPRISILFPLWHDALVELGYGVESVLIFRHPQGFIDSVRRINPALSPEHLLLDWLHHNLCSFHFSQQIESSIVSYDRMVSTPIEVLRPIGARLGLTDAQMAGGADAIVGALYHQAYYGETTSNRLIDRVYEALKSREDDAYLLELHQTTIALCALLRFSGGLEAQATLPITSILQVFWPDGNGYSEKRSVRVLLNQDAGFHEYRVRIPSTSVGRLRIDPGSRPALIEIESITLGRCGHFDIVAAWDAENGFNGIEPGENVTAVNVTTVYSFVSISDDPRLYLTSPPSEWTGDLELRIRMRVQPNNL
jgi:hypothetical protein